MQPEFVRLHRRVVASITTLEPTEREALWRKLTALHNLPPDRWSEEGVTLLPGDDQVYFVPVTDSLRTFISRMPEGGILIEDFVRQEFLDRYFGQSKEPVQQK